MLSTIVACLAALAAFVLVGAHVSAWAGDSTLARVGAFSAALAACIVLPIVVGVKVAGRERKMPVVAGAVATFDVLCLVLLLALAPAASRSALARHGDWFLVGHEVGVVRDAMRALAPGGHVSDTGPVLVAAPPAAIDAGAEEESAEVSLREVPVVAEGVARADDLRADAPWTARQIYARRADAVVTIHVRRPVDDDDPLAALFRRAGIETHEVSGSGFVVAADGVIVTNHHVMRGAESARVVLRDGRTFDAVRVLESDPSNDLDVIAIDAEGLELAPLAEQDEVETGASVFAIGSPLGLEHTLTEGIVSAIREQGGTTMLQTQAPIAPGSSGGPLFDDRGRIVGVNTASRTAGMHFSVHVHHVRALLAEARTDQPLAPYVEGVHVASISLEGAPLSPVSRMVLEQISVVLARAAGTCFESWPETTPVISMSVSGRRRSDDDVSSDQGAAVDRCLRRDGGFIGFFASRHLREASDEPVTMTVRIEGIGATGSEPGHALVVRLVRGA